MIEIGAKMVAARMRYFQKEKERAKFALDGQYWDGLKTTDINVAILWWVVDKFNNRLNKVWKQGFAFTNERTDGDNS